MRRSGINLGYTGEGRKGVYAMPVMPNFYASHRWLRELGRHQAGTLVAVDFVIPDDTEVLVGHYSEASVPVTATEAARVVTHAEQPLGYEVVVPRRVEAREIKRVRNVPQVVGWRSWPPAHGNRPCACEFCSRGQPGGARIRAAP